MFNFLKCILLIQICFAMEILGENTEVTVCSTISSETSGIYTIHPASAPNNFEAYCDLNFIGEKWTVIQQRVDASVDFNNSYDVYKRGFGDLTGSHWLGLDNIHWITKDGDYELYIDLEASNGEKTYARYSTFKVGDSNSGYRLTVLGFSGNTDDHFPMNNGQKFTTVDVDQDEWEDGNCAELYTGGWWFEDCGPHSNLNGGYNNSAAENDDNEWFDIFKETILHKKVRMLVRKKF